MGKEGETNSVTLPRPPLPKEYAEAGLTVRYDYKSGRWIVVNNDENQTKLHPIRKLFQDYYLPTNSES